MRDLWLSVHPRWATAILAGTKTVELRRRAPTLEPNAKALVYATTPVRAVVGSSLVTAVVTLPLDDLWCEYGVQSAVTREEFDAYFHGLEVGVAIVLSDVEALPREVPLSELRDHGEYPAQGWRYLPRRSTDRLLLLGAYA